MALEDTYQNHHTKPEYSDNLLESNDVDNAIKPNLSVSNQDLHYLYQHAPIGIIMSILSALLSVWFLLDTAPEYFYIPWLTFISLSCAVHVLLIKEFGKHRNTLHVDNQWAIYHTVIVTITGLTFSLAYLIFLPLLDSFTQAVLLLIISTMAVTYLPVLSVFLPERLVAKP